MQERESLAVRTMERVNQADVLFLCRFHHDSSGTIAEERASGTVLIVGDSRHLVGTNHDDTLVATALNHIASYVECIHEAAAGSGEVECKGILQSQLAQHDRCCRWMNIIRCSGCYKKRINAIGVGTGLLHQ